MRRIEVFPGDRYGELVVLREVVSLGEPNPWGKRMFLCRCACGREVFVRLDHLRSTHTESCGNCGLEYRGQRRSIRGWAKWAGIPESTLRARLKRGMGLGEALEAGGKS